MASNSNEWAPLPQRKRPDKRTRDNQTKVLAQLKEMFGTTFEADIIATVANHCQYKLEPAIETLITLSSQSASQPSNSDFLKAQPAEDDLWQADEFPPTDNPWLEGGITEEELRRQHEEMKRFETAKSSDSTRQKDPEGEDDDEDDDDDDDDEESSPQSAAREGRKVETSSLCGLKVQYRPKGIDYKSDDDADADVVIEDEASDYKVEPEPVSVCHFLATPTQCPPKNTFPKVECVSTPSPPCTPRRQLPPNSAAAKPLTAHEKHLQRIESDISKGWKVIVILRGCPGSGKSYLAQSTVSRTINAEFQKHIFSADDYFSHVNGGVYVFDPSKLHDAHAYCHSRVANAARLGVSPIVVDNTNTQAWEMRPYAVIGVENGYIIETLEPNTLWSRKASELEKRNQHGVPKLKIQMMLDRYELNISGDRLIRMFNLGYAPYNRPPQMRKVPPLSSPKPMARASHENALSTIAKEYSNLETLCKASGVPESVKSTPLLSIEGNSFKEENLIDLANLGAIGSERKISNADQVKADESLVIELPKLGAIGSERKTSKEEVAREEAQQTMKLVDTEPTAKRSLDEDKTDGKMNTSGAFETTEEEEDYFLDAEEMISRDSESSKNSATPSDHSTDFEKVDMIDFGGNPENKAKEKEQKSEAPVVGLGSIFSYIKNSFLGSEKEEPTLSPKVENEEAASKIESEPAEQVKKESEELTTTVIPIDKEEHDTLSQKLLTRAASDVTNRNLTISVQENVEVVDVPKNDNEKVVKELLEACTEFQLVETLDYSATREEEDDESIISEKSFAEELKNLQAFMKSKEDDSGAAKASIEIILNDKNNILKEQQNHSSPPAEVLSDDNGNAVNNINLISWRESPFPVENVQNLPETIDTDAQAKSESHDKETFTDPYDFNVAFIGADDFKVLEARNRSINEGNLAIVDGLKTLGRKLMLHKGTMTNTTGILYSETIFDLEVDPQSEYRGEELVEKFAYIPRSYVLDVYDNLCRRDFNWATEYLKNLEFEDVVMALSLTEAEKEKALDGLEKEKPVDGLEKEKTAIIAESAAIEFDNKEKKQLDGALFDPTPMAHRPLESLVAKKVEPAKQRTSSSESSTSSPQRQPRKPRKNRQKNIVTQELERELQEKFVLSEESYPSHTLRVKRWKNRDFSPKRQAEQNLISFEDQPRLDLRVTRLEHPAAMEDDQATTDGESSEEEEEEEPGEEMMELKLGYEFIRVLEAEFGNPDFPNSDGLFPVIQIRKSMAQELYALWIDSMQQQLWSMQEQLDAMIAKDAEYARTLEAEEDEDLEEAIGISEPEVPNLREIMDMEMALAMYSKDSTNERKGMSHKQMEIILTRDTLLEMFPDCDRDMIFEIYDAHDRNFDETVKVIKENCFTKCKLTMADILKKRRHLIDELQKESRYQTSKHNELENEGLDEACGGEAESNQCATYEDALDQAHESRSEAQYQLALRNENYRKANEAYRKKNPQVAAYYSDVAKLHIRNMEVANSAAASAFLAAQAHMLDAGDTLDLHFLHVAEAKEALQIYLDHQLSQLSPGGRKHIFIITGRGLRSVNGQSKIKPAVAKELNSKNLRFTEVNPGMLRVLLRKK